MNKYLKIALLSTLFSSAVYADDCCKPVSCCSPEIHPYIGLEGNYSWIQTDGLEVNVVNVGRVRANEDKNGWGGRLYAGLLKQVCGPFGVAAEIGYGYFGDSRFGFRDLPSDVSSADSRFKTTLSGFDVLAGVVYNRPCFDLFFKAGGLVQNSQIDLRAPVEADEDGLASLRANSTQVLPEIKLGGSYHVSCNLAITAAWTHAFGTNPKLSVDVNPVTDTNLFRMDTRNPTQDTVSLGLLYCI